MTNSSKRATVITAFSITALLLFVSFHTAGKEAPMIPEPVVEVKQPLTPLQHRRETWLSALEWCESRGVKLAINKMDLDGTPSYYSFQFKPSTFKLFSVKYGLVTADLEDADYMNLMTDYELMRDVVRHMIDDPQVIWENQFPDCVKRVVGRPPVK